MRIRFTKLAADDVRSVYGYTVALYGDEAARRFMAQLQRNIDALSAFPAAGREGRIDGTRELIIPQTPFVVPYRVAKREIHILAVVHTARQWPDAL